MMQRKVQENHQALCGPHRRRSFDSKSGWPSRIVCVSIDLDQRVARRRPLSFSCVLGVASKTKSVTPNEQLGNRLVATAQGSSHRTKTGLRPIAERKNTTGGLRQARRFARSGGLFRLGACAGDSTGLAINDSWLGRLWASPRFDTTTGVDRPPSPWLPTEPGGRTKPE